MNIEKLFPEFKDNIWGGTRLIEKYGKKTDMRPCAESWELSCHKDGSCRIRDGRLLSEVIGDDEIGKNAVNFPFFPMLIKFIDAKENLSVQVHPSDSYALKNENSFGKTEMWYIIEADEGAGIYLGFNNEVTRTEVESAIKGEYLTELLNFYPVKSGDCFFIPSGTIHAIGSGCLICEIQQNSNLTYRVYDYGRRNKNGNQRELHIEKALTVSDFGKYETKQLTGNLLGISKYFTVTKMNITSDTYIPMDGATFKCITVVSGQGKLCDEEISAGDSYFVPATAKEFVISGSMDVIISEVRKYFIDIEQSSSEYTATLRDDLGNKISSFTDTDEIGARKKVLSSVNMQESDLS